MNVNSHLFPHPSSLFHTALDPNPVHANHNIHALLLGAIPLVAQRSVLLGIPERAHRAVHAAAAGSAAVRGRARVLDDGAVGDVLVGGLRRLGGVGGGVGGLFDEGLEEVVLWGRLASNNG